MTTVGVASEAAAAQSEQKVVYHLSETDRAVFVLSNIRNHIEAVGPNLRLALVVHGPPLRLFRRQAEDTDLAHHLAFAQAHGAMAYACIHTMEGMGLKIADLLPGFEVATKGGVVKLTELQIAGYAYLRP